MYGHRFLMIGIISLLSEMVETLNSIVTVLWSVAFLLISACWKMMLL